MTYTDVKKAAGRGGELLISYAEDQITHRHYDGDWVGYVCTDGYESFDYNDALVHQVELERLF